MVIACALSLIGGLIVMGSLGSLAAIDTTSNLSSYEAGEALGGAIFGSLLGMIFTFPAWIIKIIAIVFSFITYGKLKTPVSLQNL